MAGRTTQQLVDPLTGQPVPTTSTPQQQQPASTEKVGVGLPAAGGAGQTPAQAGAPQATPAPSNGLGAGTGYVNLSRVLGANIGASNGVVGAANTAQQAQRLGFNKDSKTYTDARDKAKAGTSLQGGELTDPLAVDNGLMAGGGGLANSLKTFDYGKFDPGWKSEDAQRLDALGNSKSAGRQLANDNGLGSQYGPKLSALDAAIYGSDQEAGGMARAKQAGDLEHALQSDSIRTTNQTTDKMKNDSASIADKNRGFLGGLAKNYTSNSGQAAALSSLLGDPNLTFGTAGSTDLPSGADNVGFARSFTPALQPNTVTPPTTVYGEGSERQRPTIHRTRLIGG